MQKSNILSQLTYPVSGRSGGLIPGLCNAIAHTLWHHTASYYGNSSKTGCFLVANMASYPSLLLPGGLVLAICALHSRQLRKVGVGGKWGRQFSDIQGTVDGTLSFRSQSSFALLSLPDRPRGKLATQNQGENAQELLDFKRNTLRAAWVRSRTWPP